MVVQMVYHGRPIEVIRYIIVYGKGVSVVHNNMRREGSHDNKSKHYVEVGDSCL